MPRRTFPRSITWRLTFYYALALAGTLVLLGTSLYTGLSRQLQADALRRVDSQARAIALELSRPGNEEGHHDLEDENLVATNPADEILIQITSAQGRIVNRSLGLGGKALPTTGGEGARVISWNGRPLAFISLPILVNGRPVGSVQVAQPLGQMAGFLASLARILVWGGLVGIGLAMAGGVLISRAALSPVDAITQTARQITAGDLSRRIPVPATGDELALLARTMNEMLARLQAAFDREEAFVADASHELRTPLAVIEGRANLLLRWGKDDPAVLQESLEAIARETGGMKRLIGNLLVLARGSDDVGLSLASVDLAALVKEVCEAGQVIAAQPGGAVAVELGELQPVTIRGDRDRLRQALLILIDNGITYNRPGGTVTLALRSVDGQAELSVEDTGLGIAPQDLPRIFDRFFRADRARSREYGGTGLGLSIARLIARAHGGDIDARSGVGHGSTFTLRLPLGGPR